MNALTKGILFIACSASSYGMLATVVKLSYRNEYTTAEVTVSQFLLGIIIIGLLNLIFPNAQLIPTTKDKRQLILSGTSLGFTSVLYYLCIKYLNASVAVVLLMQSVWIGVVLETIITKKAPSLSKIIAVVLVLSGTLLATHALSSEVHLNAKGLLFGILASISFSTTLFSTNRIANHLPPFKRSFYMLLGGGIIISIFAFITQFGPTHFGFDPLQGTDISIVKPFDTKILYTFGILLSLFGTVLPPIFLNKGFPLAGVGIGSIVAAFELPVSVTISYFILSETVVGTQWLGIAIILSAIVLMNVRLIKKKV